MSKPALSITNTLTEQTMTISITINLNPWTARKLTNILKRPFFVYLHTYHFGILSPIIP
jgi:hypothetical protein